MILCIDKQALKNDPKTIQKDLDFDGLLKSNTSYFEDAESAYKANYVPLDFCISIRSVYTNKVVKINFEGKNLYYYNITNVQEYPHKGYDLIMFLASISIMSLVNYKADFDEIMAKSAFSLIGLYNPNSNLINPIIYSHIIIGDDDIEKFSIYLKEGNELEDIKDINREGNFPVLLDSFIELKEK